MSDSIEGLPKNVELLPGLGFHGNGCSFDWAGTAESGSSRQGDTAL